VQPAYGNRWQHAAGKIDLISAICETIGRPTTLVAIDRSRLKICFP
jgi:hypothetical protein